MNGGFSMKFVMNGMGAVGAALLLGGCGGDGGGPLPGSYPVEIRTVAAPAVKVVAVPAGPAIAARAMTGADLRAAVSAVPGAQVQGFTVTLPEEPVFQHPSAWVQAPGREAMTRIAALMLADPRVHVDIVAHDHWDGRAAKALAESQKRAVALQGVLISRGVPASRTRAIGAGDRHPVVANATPAGRMANRRIQLVFTFH